MVSMKIADQHKVRSNGNGKLSSHIRTPKLEFSVGDTVEVNRNDGTFIGIVSHLLRRSKHDLAELIWFERPKDLKAHPVSSNLAGLCILI